MESEKEKTPPETILSITDQLIAALCKNYHPEGPQNKLELKSSVDIMEDMSAIAEVEKWEIAIAMEKSGFQISYTDAGAFWKMYKI